MPKLAIIADDLTGANDTGVQFRKFGLRSLVLFKLEQDGWIQDADVIVVDTDSRTLPPSIGAERIRAVCRTLVGIGVRNFYKKIDSTLRGNIGAEIAAAWEEVRPAVMIVAPAFPKAGRNTVGGYQLLNGVPISLTEISRDPQTPVKEAYLPRLLADFAGERIGVVPLHIVSEGAGAIGDFMSKLVAAGRTWIVCDASCEEHLGHIATAALQFERILWVGSAGLAEQLALAKKWVGSEKVVQEPIACNTVLVVSGSVSAVTEGQLRQYEEDVSSFNIVLDPVAAIEAPLEEGLRLTAGAVPLMKQTNVVLSCSNDRNMIEAAVKAGENIGLGANVVSERIAEVLGLAVINLVKHGAEGLFMTGGETAINCCRALGASGVEIFAEVVPGIPMGRLIGGEFQGLPIITKAGAFGDLHAITNAIKALKGR